MKLITRILKLKEMEGEMDSDSICKFIKETLFEYELNEKNLKIASDNGPNIVGAILACNIKNIRCSCHIK